MRVHKRLVVLVVVGVLLWFDIQLFFDERSPAKSNLGKRHRLSQTLSNTKISFVSTNPINMSNTNFSSAVRSEYDPRNRNSSTSTAEKRPYWAGTEDDGAKKEPDESPARDSGYAYNYVANPYAENPERASTHPGPNPHYINAEEVKQIAFPRVREGCWARWAAHERVQPREPLLSPGDIANEHQTEAPAAAEPSSPPILRKVSKHVRFDLDNVVDIAKATKRSLSKKGKGLGRKGKESGAPLQISAPLPGSLKPQGPTPLFPEDGSRPLEVVPLAEAQENRLKYGRPDHELDGISAAAVARRASAVAAAEKKYLYSPSPVPSSPPLPVLPKDAPKEPKIARKPAPSSSAARPQPPRQDPPTPIPVVPHRNPLRVVNTASTETVWADFVEAGKDDSWTKEPQYQNGGQGPVEQDGRTPSRIAREARVLDFLEGGRLPDSPQ